MKKHLSLTIFTALLAIAFAPAKAAAENTLKVNIRGLAVTPPDVDLGPPSLQLSSMELNFGGVLAGNSASMSVTLTNLGPSPAVLGIPHVTPGVSGFTADSACPSTLAPQASCATEVRFSSLQEGDNSASLAFPSNATGSPHTVNLLAKSLSPYELVLNASGVRTYRDGKLAESCLRYLQPTAPYRYTGSTGSGLYRIDVGGQQGNVYCDMTTNGGGYTVIQVVKDSRHYGTPYVLATDASPPRPGQSGGSYLSGPLAAALINVATEVRVQEIETSKFVSSTHPTVLGNLRAGRLANFTTASTSDQSSLWYQSQAGLAPMSTTCATGSAGQTGSSYPLFFWACGNTNGFHFGTTGNNQGNASWKYLTPNGVLTLSYR